jgi:hypothetical protein
MRSRFLRALSLAPLVLAAPLLAQQAGDIIEERLPVIPPPPPPLESIPADDETLAPPVTIQRGSVEEYRANGQLYMIKIVPEAGPPYYLIDNDGDGELETRSAVSPGATVPKWILWSF